MGRKLRRLLIFLLIILKKPNMPEAACKCEPCDLCAKGFTSIPQDRPTSIAKLDLRHDHIKTVKQSELSKYKDLFLLRLNCNQITKIEAGSFARLHKLNELDLCNNQITTIPSGTFANLPQLQKLWLSYNKITTIPSGTFSNLPELQLLSLGGNHITNIDFGTVAGLRGLASLTLQSNQITTIPSDTFAKMPKLSGLILNNNTIATIHSGTFQKLPHLSHLSLTRNQITTIHSGIFANLRMLEQLYLRSNQITYIPSGTFANLSKLQTLDLIDNQIITIPSGTFANLCDLKELWLHNNQITIIHSGAFENLPQLQSLDLHNNQITTIHSGAFVNQPIRLKDLKLQGNNMSAIPLSVFGLFPRTHKIQLDGNPWQCDCRMASFKQIPYFENQIICTQPAKVQGKTLSLVDPKDLTCKEPTRSPLTVGSFSAAVSTPSVGNTESNISSSVFKITAGSTANPTKNKSKTISRTSHYLWYFKVNAAPMSDPDSTSTPAGKKRVTLTPPLAITANKLESAPSSPLPVLIGSICGPVAGIVLIGAIILTVWCKIKSRRPGLGLNPNVVGGNTNRADSVLASNDNHGDTDNPGNLSNTQVLAVLMPNPMYAGEGRRAMYCRKYISCKV